MVHQVSFMHLHACTNAELKSVLVKIYTVYRRTSIMPVLRRAMRG